jgi:hypothetical protein
VLGKIICTLGGETLQEYNIRAKTSVEKISFSSVFHMLLLELLMK